MKEITGKTPQSSAENVKKQKNHLQTQPQSDKIYLL